MISAFNVSRFLDVFIDETQETLQKIEPLLLEFEQHGSVTPDQINDLFRYLHTLKGNSSSIGYNYFSRLAHQLESFLDAMRHNRITYTKKSGELLFKGYDLLGEIFALEIQKEVNSDIFNSLCELFLADLSNYESHPETLSDDTRTEQDTLHVTPVQHSGEGISFGFFDDPLPEDVQESASEEPSAVTGRRPIASGSIRINLDKIDSLMNNIGELVIAMSMLEQFAAGIDDPKIKNGFTERIGYLHHTIRDLQDSVMSTRMVPMEQVYSKFPKLIRDIAKKLDKDIHFNSNGKDVEIDKAMIEGLNDPLMHIIRNACDHGIEPPSERLALGKPADGSITLEAAQANEQIMITITDDGRGIDTDRLARKALEQQIISRERCDAMSDMEKLYLIFEPGLSTAGHITDLSGRGVGMDVVRSNINRLGGTIQIESHLNRGTTLRLLLPLTLAIVDVLNVVCGNALFFLPLSNIVESLQPDASMIQSLGNHHNEVLILREEAIPVVRLHEIFNLETSIRDVTQGMLIIVRYGTDKIALFIDMFLHQQQVVIKPIDKNFKAIEGVSGASIRGDGSIGLILDISAIALMHQRHQKGYR